MSIRCGHCKQYHESLDDVRQCSWEHVGYTASTVTPAPKQQPTLPLPRPQQDSRQGTDVWARVRHLGNLLPATKRAHYAVKHADGDWKFYRVDKPQQGRWIGYTFLKVQAGEEFWPIKRPEELINVFQAILDDPALAAEEYGHRIGKCSICNRTLTVPESIERGIGPVCADRMGW